MAIITERHLNLNHIVQKEEAMMAENFLEKTVEIHRNMNPLWYLATIITTTLTITILVKRKHLKIGSSIIFVSLVMNLVWEVILYAFDMRINKEGFFVNLFNGGWILEIIYHGIFETGSTLALGIEGLDYFNVIDLDGIRRASEKSGQNTSEETEK